MLALCVGAPRPPGIPRCGCSARGAVIVAADAMPPAHGPGAGWGKCARGAVRYFPFGRRGGGTRGGDP